jgi:hemin uptake protein HemP
MAPLGNLGTAIACHIETFVTDAIDSQHHAATATAQTSGLRVVSTAELFGPDSEIVLLHNGTPYRLRITRQDKLILTK